ncbi:MAG: metallophosphoesterase family protein [Candidatus Diapherotrites archaeon]|nr:metallophosphoesterase family protein [Candidatus Diapherotrites archaeon]
MKVGIFSDTHLGFSAGGKRSGDALMQAKQALQILVNERVDCIIMAGDFFDDGIPTQESWHDAFELLEIANSAAKSGVSVSLEKKESKSAFDFSGIPIIAIHGTHEHLSKSRKNALDVLQKAGSLLHVHAAKSVVEKVGDKVAVFGIGGVPEKYARDALNAWKPIPEKNALNVLVLHQSFTDFLPFDDEMTATLALEDLPKGFDLVINGHLHWSLQKQLGTTIFLLPGSTITTQIKSSECLKPKGVFILDSKTMDLEFKEIPEQRKAFHAKLKFEDARPQKVLADVEQEIEGFLKQNTGKLEPLIRVKCIGSLEKGFAQSDVNFSGIEKKFSEKALLSLDKNFDSADFKKTISELRALQLEKKSVSAMGLDMLEKKLLETSFGNAFDVKRIFELLSEGKTEDVEQILKAARKN